MTQWLDSILSYSFTSFTDAISAVANFGLLVTALFAYGQWRKQIFLQKKLNLADEILIHLSRTKEIIDGIRNAISFGPANEDHYEGFARGKYDLFMKFKDDLYGIGYLKIKSEVYFPEVDTQAFDKVIDAINDIFINIQSALYCAQQKSINDYLGYIKNVALIDSSVPDPIGEKFKSIATIEQQIKQFIKKEAKTV